MNRSRALYASVWPRCNRTRNWPSGVSSYNSDRPKVDRREVRGPRIGFRYPVYLAECVCHLSIIEHDPDVTNRAVSLGIKEQDIPRLRRPRDPYGQIRREPVVFVTGPGKIPPRCRQDNVMGKSRAIKGRWSRRPPTILLAEMPLGLGHDLEAEVGDPIGLKGGRLIPRDRAVTSDRLGMRVRYPAPRPATNPATYLLDEIPHHPRSTPSRPP
jgi:hypothetical protein